MHTIYPTTSGEKKMNDRNKQEKRPWTRSELMHLLKTPQTDGIKGSAHPSER